MNKQTNRKVNGAFLAEVSVVLVQFIITFCQKAWLCVLEWDLMLIIWGYWKINEIRPATQKYNEIKLKVSDLSYLLYVSLSISCGVIRLSFTFYLSVSGVNKAEI